jgi:hypothetical protein
MRTVAQKVFQVAYRTKNQGVEGWILVEANDFIEALDVFKSHFKDYEVTELENSEILLNHLLKLSQ